MDLIMGMNSGSSFDGIDVVLCETEIDDDGFPKAPKFLCGGSYDWPENVRGIVTDAFVNKVDMIGLNRLNYICGAVFAEKAVQFMKEHQIDSRDIKVLGLDTQTIYQEQPNHKAIAAMSAEEKAKWPERWLSGAYPAGMQMQLGIEAACKDLGITDYTILAADSSLETQVSQIENLVTMGCDVILLNPYDSDGVANAVAAALDAGVGVFTMDIDCEGSTAFVASDNYVVGQMLGDYIVKKLGGEGQVAIIDGISVTSLKDRTDGFMATIKDSNIKVVAEQQTAMSRDTALASAETILQAHPDINAFVGVNENSGMAILSAVTSANLSGIILTTVDATSENMAAIRDGKVDVGISQNPYMMGYTAVEQALKWFNGESIEEFIEVPVEYMTIDNVSQYIEREKGYGVEVG